ncbi:alpha/beta hydrolase [Natronosporangium hydrolyticum]|uniref:Alpha/beta hydrolase n=1 Tax=Natronosporangium hydrolyticum TaxID=2811111 RepID=A0A895YP51_9ACTN|nr:alpha/beta hydrolase [Natronosporangium hydrolyticum]QSB15890.1 alpha/beta hydrolase [Natronosporangium hydrolyticum]
MEMILVHGAGGTPTTWDSVAPRLRDAGHRVQLVSNPMHSLAGDVANTARALAGCAGPVLLVGHSYGGAVITNVGTDPRVVGLVYIAAFAPDQGESVQAIVERYPAAEVHKHMRRGPDGEWASEHTEEYWAEIGWDLTEAQRRTFDEGSRPSANAIFTEATGEPAWRDTPSWYLVAAQDRTLRPEIQRDMAARAGATVTEVPGSHFTPLVWPQRVADLVTRAAGAVTGGLP